MDLPKLITDLVEAQNSRDVVAYASFFSENAVVFDEGKTHTGKEAIQNWIEKSNEEYQSVLKPVSYKNSDNGSVLEAEVSGTFPGSSAVLHFNFTFQHSLVRSLKITG